MGAEFIFAGIYNHDAYINIENQSLAPITVVSIRYETTQHRDVIGTIEPHSSYCYRVDARFQETAVYLSYIDQYQQHIEQVAIGYSAKYDPVNIKIVIESFNILLLIFLSDHYHEIQKIKNHQKN